METSTKVLAAAGVVAVAATAAAVVSSTATGPSALAGPPPTAAEAARFLTQATFGPTDQSIAEVQSLGYEGWINQQLALPTFSFASFMDTRSGGIPGYGYLNEAFWSRAITGADQLRQRMQFALSEIFVVSRDVEQLEQLGVYGTGAYYDLLGRNAFGNFRTLIKDVTTSPIMGVYLSSIKNEKEDPVTGRHPDENFAREIMQLMTIGPVRLNQNGSVKKDLSGVPIPTYTHDDIAGLAKVFTGMSWAPRSPGSDDFYSGDIAAYRKPMGFYPSRHSTSEKKFLGVTIPASATPNIDGDLNIAMDALFNHANVGPFIARRLIQRFVTSNPSPAYISRIAGVFSNNGQGVRGDLGAVIKAILLDTEARDGTAARNSATFGKLREPIIRLANWARAFKATSDNGNYLILSTASPIDLAQGWMYSPSVFNYFRPGYVPPQTQMGDLGLTVPEMQIVTELSAASYINFINSVIRVGAGYSSFKDVKSTYVSEVALADTPAALIERLNLLLFYGQMPTTMRDQIIAAVNAAPGGTAANRLARVRAAILLCMASAEYLVQR